MPSSENVIFAVKLIFHGHNNGYTISKRSDNLYTTVFIEDKTAYMSCIFKAYRYTKK